MKKFERMPAEKRKEEIQLAALKLFNTKGFASTTMENIVEQVSLSKGGVYRIYSSTSAILCDLMIKGMQLRNAYYEQCARRLLNEGKSPDLDFLVRMIGDSMLLYPEISSVYVEFLWEKQRRPELQKLYDQICEQSIKETENLISSLGTQALFNTELLAEITELMNAAILSLHVLNMNDFYRQNRDKICDAISRFLSTLND